ncbi:MAG: N-acetyl-gamma-glutamyl-phosphate reductase [Chthoniobacterales bacterium]
MNPKDRTRCAVIGASGYAGEELVRLLIAHPRADLAAVTSRQNVGRTLGEAFPRFDQVNETSQLRFSDSDAAKISDAADLVFLALPHGVSASAAQGFLDHGARIIDLSADFRLRDRVIYKEYYGAEHPAPELLSRGVYGLPEFYRAKIVGADLVACPGCYPTSILLPLLPLLQARLISPERITVASLSGVSGAGRKVEADYLFAECNESARPYGVPKHRHLSEIEQELKNLAGATASIQFVPHLVPMNRGIVSTIFVDLANAPDEQAIEAAYQTAYDGAAFVRLLGTKRLPDTKNVVGTNFIDISWKTDPRTGRLVVMSAIDNLIKGTSGQAIQCLNLMFGYPEPMGLL